MRYFTLRVENVSKKIGEYLGLENLTLNVESGEIIGVLGPKGSGKTSFVKILLGNLKPQTGNVFVAGKNVIKFGQRRKARIGYLLPVYKWLFGLTARIYVLLIAKLSNREIDNGQLVLLAKRFGINLDKKMKAYSIQELQALRLVFAFLEPVDLIVLDEPVQNLSTTSKDWYHRYLKIARANGVAILFTTESISEVERVCDWVVLMRDGKFVAKERGVHFRARTMRKIEMRFSNPVSLDKFNILNNFGQLYLEGNQVRCLLTGEPDQLIKLASKMRVTDFISTPPSLDETLAIYNQAAV